MPPASLSGSLVNARAQLDCGIADGDAVADFQIKPRQQRRIDRRAERAAVLRQQRGKRQAGSVTTVPNNG